MRSNPHHPAQEATSLEDSTYEVLDHPGDLSDDDGHTASVASTSPDDMSVTLSETESEGEDYFGDAAVGEADQLAESATADPLDDQVIAAGEDSTLTERPGLGDSEGTFHFKMEERATESFAGTEGFSIVKEFTPEQSSSKVLEPYGCSEIRLTVRAGLVDRFYPDRGSFRVLFVGAMDNWSEEGIKASLLNALLASPGSSKSVMVRGQMQPYSPILHTDLCIELETRDGGKGSRVVFKLEGDDGAEIVLSVGWRGGRFKEKHGNSTPLPDLAIFCHPKSSTSSLVPAQLLQARRALLANGIPSIDITDHRRFNEASPDTLFYPKSLYVCVEGRQTPDHEFGLVDRLPVDVYTFMHLDPSDLNRHLASISPRLHNTRSSNSSRKTKSWSPMNLLPSFMQQSDAPLTMVLTVLLWTALITAAFLSESIPQLKQSTNTSGVVPTEMSSALTPSVISAAVATASEVSITAASAPSVKDKIDEFFAKQRETTAKGLLKTVEDAEQLKVAARLYEKLEKKKAEMRRREEASKVAKIGGFEIQTSGDQQFILRPAKGFIGRTRKPQLQIQVSRDSKAVPIRYERTIDGVYVVDLEREYSVGSFNVSIATHSKPLMQQSFNIDLGRNQSCVGRWLSFFQEEAKQWASTVQREPLASVSDGLTVARHRLQHLSSNIVQQAQAVSTRVITDGRKIWNEKIVRQEVLERVQQTTKKIDHQLNEVCDQTWTGLRQVTAPVRTSRRTLWARNNAYLLRCGVERAVGLSSKEKDGKKTRSCEAANW
ncbi:hypothetical protein BU23DRAFT_555020 [Bimuria novae-zelandiae CBS 107.79]|uniref:Uncharacterized protein n=1 Tax=Bimuria novae-zelandiae CBS 107.79 TaxID=1447943 RepID=A0A6A5V5Y4_9PLEO|nr:hypothetical protein BU23DRAFT_555020 [Bimuria novae-zelandiae CBS 107.79]